MQPEIRMFYEDCAAGEFYSKSLVAIGEYKNMVEKIPDVIKKQLKEKLFRHVFYGSTGNYHKDPKVRDERQQVLSRFSLAYSSVVKNLTALKRTHKKALPFVYELTRKGKKKGKMYATPNCMAQRFESKIILDHIAPIMFQMGAPVLTIHDAFILEERHSELLLQVIEQTFTQQLNVKPPKVHLTRLTTGQQ